jgi:hypothetical protein
MNILPICETPYEFEVISEVSGHGMGVFISVISQYAQKVNSNIKGTLLLKQRMAEVKASATSSSAYYRVEDEREFEIHSAVLRVVGWREAEEEFTYDNLLDVCSTNQSIRKQIIRASNDIGLFLDSLVEQLVNFTKNELKLSEKQKDGATYREHLKAVEEMTGITPQELTTVEVSHIIMYLWEWFLDLNSTRQSGMGMNAISYSEICAWCELTGNRPSPYEIRVIKLLDRVYLEHYNSKQDKESSDK